MDASMINVLGWIFGILAIMFVSLGLVLFVAWAFFGFGENDG